MALALQAINKAWMKVNTALQGASPAAQMQFKALKLWLTTQKNVQNIQFIPFSAEDIVTNGGYSPDIDANTIYGVYLKGRRTTGTTASFVSVNAAADNSATTTTVLTARFKDVSQEYVLISPSGIACETEIAIAAATTVGGATESAAADACDGFVIVGA